MGKMMIVDGPQVRWSRSGVPFLVLYSRCGTITRSVPGVRWGQVWCVCVVRREGEGLAGCAVGGCAVGGWRQAL